MNIAKGTVTAIAVVAIVAVSASAYGSIINVPFDQPTIQSGINAASIGDTVIVAPGIYIENVLISAKPLTLLGDVLGQTVILRADLSQATNYSNPDPSAFLAQADTLPVAMASLIPTGGGITPLTLANNTSDVVEVAGFTIEMGSSAPGLYCANSRAFIHHNHFRKNNGSGILCSGGQRSKISENLFTENSAYAGGGAAVTGGAAADLYDNEFRHNRAFLGGAVFCIDDNGHTISGNRFLGNFAGGGGGGIYYYHGGVAEVTGNLFVDDTSDHGGGVDNSDRQNLHLTHNTFDRCVAGIGGGGGNAAWWAHGAPIGGTFRNNIVTDTKGLSGGGALGCDPDIVGLVGIDYNDFFNNTPADHFRFAAGPNDIFDDPMYCDAGNGDYHLVSGSPSAGTGEGGSDRGAFSAGCGIKEFDVDILPAICPNTLTIGLPGLQFQGIRPGAAAANQPRVALAILGTSTFDVSGIDPASIEVIGVEPLSHKLMDVSRPVDPSETECECHALGSDGIMDLVVYFDQGQLLAACGPVKDGDVRSLDVVGAMKSGGALAGHDCLTIKKGPTSVSQLASAGEAAEPGFGIRPNPFNAATVIAFAISSEQHVRMDIYDVLGRRVVTLVDDFLPAGQHEAIWNAAGRASGMYFARLITAEATVTKPMVLMK